MIQDCKIGTEIWYRTLWNEVNSGKVLCMSRWHIKVKGTRDTIGTEIVHREDCYLSKKELLAANSEITQKQIKQYCQEISSVEDLIRFMFNHTVSCAEEYTDWEARTAVRIRAKELLGIELE